MEDKLFTGILKVVFSTIGFVMSSIVLALLVYGFVEALQNTPPDILASAIMYGALFLILWGFCLAFLIKFVIIFMDLVSKNP